MPMHANRGIAMPTVIIILLAVASVAGWVLYLQNRQPPDEIADSGAKLLAQIRANSQLQATIDALESSQAQAKGQIDTLNRQVEVLRSEIADKMQRLSLSEQADQDRPTPTTEQSQTAKQTETLARQTESPTRQVAEETSLLNSALMQCNGERDQTLRQVTALTQARENLKQTLVQCTRERDQAQRSDLRGRQKLTELVNQIGTGQQDSEAYRKQLDSARQELATTSERAKILIERVQSLQASRVQERLAFDELRDKLEAELGKNSVDIEQDNYRFTLIRLQEDVLFSSGSAQLLESAQVVLSSIGHVLKRYPERHIQVEGHTDDLPIVKSTRYPSNWELSAARASSAVRFLIESTAIAPRRLRATGIGKYNPIGDNSTPQGRARNRRIEIKLLPVGLTEISMDSVGN